ncbi:MAG TPA: coenzyme F430 synthase [Methanospirillum sp.]|uniref:coenzyme F430 synthase n=1 Tax=Methanospirillum sp. TaxID=45200 RepID=UPI002BB3DB50|nr:coenzyme F430 synthase [Methanospirillum sp.]HWQ63581.1 coenzyme F430 synthase [Methanospirillum sp.]
MNILILDTIHGGIILGDALRDMGHAVDLVDVYRGDLTCQGSIPGETAISKTYDLLIHPVHLDPANPILRSIACPSITHHEAVRWILHSQIQQNFLQCGFWIEVSGARGKTTTATALASIMQGSGILHSSRGIYRYPEEEYITRMSITPASLIPVKDLLKENEWCIAEISLGFTGLCDIAILTSHEDYQVAAGKLSARTLKHLSALSCKKVLVAPDVSFVHDSVINAGDVARVCGTTCMYSFNGIEGSYENLLLTLEGYRVPLQLATAAALILGYNPEGLQNFPSLPGRMKIEKIDGRMIIDNASTGACLKTTCDAISLLRNSHDENFQYTLIIGQEARAVCENFSDEEIIGVINKEHPNQVILVAGDDRMDTSTISDACKKQTIPITISHSIPEGMHIAKQMPSCPIVVSVKTWR